MTVLDRSELEASPLADLHVIADQIGLEGFRRLRKADLIDAILGEEKVSAAGDSGGHSTSAKTGASSEPRANSRRSRSTRSRRGGSSAKASEDEQGAQPASDELPAPRRRTRSAGDERARAADGPAASRRGRGRSGEDQDTVSPSSDTGAGRRSRSERERSNEPERTVEGVIEILGNGSAFLRVQPPEPSEHDVYISAAQVRRCELVNDDLVSGPVRTPRRSERYSSLVRIDTINSKPADSAVAEVTRYEDLPVSYPSERLAFDSEDLTLKAIEWLTPIGRGSRAVIVGGARAGKTEALRRILGALAGREGLELSLVLAGVRPEEVSEWQQGPLTPAVTLTFAASADVKGHAVEAVLETSKRLVARGTDAAILIDGLDGLHPHTARKVLAGARNLTDGGSLTVIATAALPFGGETTVIALDSRLASTGRFPALDLVASGTLRPELLVGEENAAEIVKERAKAAGAAG
jgi:transcription termination factor Rho